MSPIWNDMEPVNSENGKRAISLEDIKLEELELPLPLDRVSMKYEQEIFLHSRDPEDEIVLECPETGQTFVLTSFLFGSNVNNANIFEENESSIIPVVKPVHLTCAVCLQLFFSRNSLIRHVFSHYTNLNVPSYIGQPFSHIFPDQLKCVPTCYNNYKIGLGGRSLLQLSCAYCIETFPSRYSMMKHIFSHVLLVSCPLYVCRHCSKVFDSLNTLQVHKNYKEVSQVYSAVSQIGCYSDFQYNTDASGILFASSGIRNESIMEQSMTVYAPYELDNQQRISPINVSSASSVDRHIYTPYYNFDVQQKFLSNKQQYVSNVYGIHAGIQAYDKSFTDHNSNKNHNKIHSNKYPYNCEECGKSFNQLSSVKKHRKVHMGGNIYTCEVCGLKYSQFHSLKRHQIVHTGERPYTCKVCGVKFAQSGNLKNHQRIHSGERPFSCELCGKSFTESSHLKDHKRTHTGERPFTCGFCGKLFTVSSHLRRHERIHNGERPYTCQLCEKTFRELGQLKTHLRSHTGEKPFTCNICQKSFKSSSYLNIHKRIHTGERPFICKLCGNSFTESSSLNKHNNRVHSGVQAVSCKVGSKPCKNPGNLRKGKKIHR